MAVLPPAALAAVKKAADAIRASSSGISRPTRGAKTAARQKMVATNDHDEDPVAAVDEREESAKALKADPDADVAQPDEADGVTTPPQKKKRAPRKPKEPIVYVIPPVEQLPTTFQGRLGYACLNTILRVQKPPVFCSRTCRIDTIKKEGMDYLKELGRKNIIDLKALIEWNAAHNIRFMRMSSEMFPFAPHPEYGYTLEYAAEELKEAGDTAKRLGVRLTTHPGQFTQLGSPRAVVVKNAFRDLAYHTEIFERMGLDKDAVMIIHGGGVFGDKDAAIARFKENFRKMPQNVRERLVLENDEICYNADDLLPVCEELDIPMVFDYHHDQLYPSSKTPAEMMPRILATWAKRNIKPKQHLSEPRRGAVSLMERRAHADRCQRLPADLPDDMDLMIEAKDKEQSVFHLYRIYGLHPTIHDSLRPPVEEETLHTGGRKSSKKKKVKTEGEEADPEEAMLDEDGNPAAPPTPTPAAKETPKRKRGPNKVKNEAVGTAVKTEVDTAEILPAADGNEVSKPPIKKRRVSAAAKKKAAKDEGVAAVLPLEDPEDVKMVAAELDGRPIVSVKPIEKMIDADVKPDQLPAEAQQPVKKARKPRTKKQSE